MQLDDLKVWINLVETKSFSACAKLNFLTQPAVSQKVKRLEAELGCTLLLRRGRDLSLTPAGQILYEESQKIGNLYQKLLANLKSSSGIMQGELKVATIYSIGLYELNACVKHFLKKYPRVDLNIEFSHAPKIYQDLLERRIEIGFVAYPKAHPRLRIIPFKNDRLILVTHPKHPLAKFKRLDIRKIAGYDFIGFKKEIPTRAMLDEVFQQYHVEVKIKTEFDNIETIKQAVEIGAGISILPRLTVQKECDHRLLVGIPFSNAKLPRQLAAVVRDNESLSLPAEKFILELA